MFNKTVTLVSSVFPSTVMFEVPWRLLQALQFDNGICLIETAFRLSVFPTQWLAARVIYYSPSKPFTMAVYALFRTCTSMRITTL